MAKLSEIGRQDLWIFCVLCTHYSRWRVVDLQARFRRDFDLDQAIGRFKCTNCGTFSAAVRYKAPSNDLKLLRKYKVPKKAGTGT